MEKVRYYFETNPEEYKVYTLDEMSSLLTNLNIEIVYLDDAEIWKLKNNNVLKSIYNTEEYPFCLEKDKTLYINPTYYQKHKEEVDSFLEQLFKRMPVSSFFLYPDVLITPRFLKALAQNPHLKELYIGKDYQLTLEDYQILKESTIKEVNTKGVCEELKDNFDPLISCNFRKKLLGRYRYKDLIDDDWAYLIFNEKINSEELPNLKYLQNNELEIRVTEENIEEAIFLSEKLFELGKKNPVIIDVKNKQNVLNHLLKNEKFLNKNIKLYIDLAYVTPEKFISGEKKLEQLREGVNNLSPFEKYIFDYNIAKKFKPYKENKDDAKASRNLYEILDNDYLVCVGFAKILEELTKRDGIPSIEHNVMVDTSYDDKDENECVVATAGGHARRYLYIKDPKYGIDGFYVADPTWDNVMDKDLYNHLVLTNKEETMTLRYNFLSHDTFELFNVDSIEEFYQKINFLLDRIDEKIYKNLSSIISYLFSNLKELSPAYTKDLIARFPELTTTSYLSKFEHEKEIIYDMGSHIVSKVNKPISGETIMMAVREILRKIYHLEGEDLEKILEKIKKDNNKRQQKVFPKRYKIDEFGNQIELENITDKFNFANKTESLRL